MSLKPSWVIGISLLLTACSAGTGFYRAEFKEWDLLNRVPTASIEESKKFGVYVSKLRTVPAEVDLGDTRYKLDEVWVEHRTEPERINPFKVRQKIYPDLILCVRMHAVGRNENLAPSDVSIATAKGKRTYGQPFNGSMCVDAGVEMPSSFLLSSARGTKVRVEITK